jgi:hypothetical protein
MTCHPERVAFWAAVTILLAAMNAHGDGKVFRPQSYGGSLEELSQEAVLIFNNSEQEEGSFEDLILKIHVKGQTDRFAWVIPFPQEPKVEKEDAQLFEELHNYVQHRLALLSRHKKGSKGEMVKGMDSPKRDSVEVLSRRTVGSYDVAVVRETKAGALNTWLKAEGFQSPPADAEDVIGFYRAKGYVFACVKVKDASAGKDGMAELHPLRFSFRTGGHDGIYFPMRMSGLQSEPFNVNLHVFYHAWLNDNLNRHGYVHRGFSLHYRDWDSAECDPNSGKSYSAPDHDPFLRDSLHLIPTLTRLFHKLHPGQRYYLTNIQAHQLNPADVRQWSDDLWLFPYYTRRSMVPYDARPGGVASAAWPDESYQEEDAPLTSPTRILRTGAIVAALLACIVAVASFRWRRRGAASIEATKTRGPK